MDRNILSRWMPLLIALVVFGASWRALRVPQRDRGLTVTLELRTTCADAYQLFWTDGTGVYDAGRSIPVLVAPQHELQRISFILPPDVRHVQGLRIDPGMQAVRSELGAIEFQGPYRTVRLAAEEVDDWFEPLNDLRPFVLDSAARMIQLDARGTDPYFASTRDLSPLTAEALDPVRPVVRPFLLALLAAFFSGLLAYALLRARPQHAPHTTVPVTPAPRADVVVALLISSAVFFLAQGIANNINFHDRALVVQLELTASQQDNFQVFYAKKPGGFGQGYYVNCPVQAALDRQVLSFRMPSDTLFSFLRIDPGNKQDSLRLHAMTLRCNDEYKRFTAADLFRLFKVNEQVSDYRLSGDDIVARFIGNDPFFYSDEDIGEDVRALWERSGNGPLPMVFGLLCAIAVFAGVVANPRFRAVRTSARPVEIATAILFGTLISLPMLTKVIPLEPNIADTEKRPLAEEPLLRMHSLLDFPAQYTKYYGDHFGFRKMLFRWNSIVHTYGLHTSSMPDNVVFGKDGYLFLIKPGVNRFYRNQEVFTEDQLERIAERLDHRKKWLAERGIDYYLLIPPLKATMYPEKLPDKYRKVDDRSELDDLKDYLEKHCTVQLIDLRDDLRKAKEVRDIYYTTDIHWNPWGGYIGYRGLMREMLKDHPELGSPCEPKDYTVKADTNDNGDLAMQIALNDKLTRVTYMLIPKVPFRAQPLPEEPLPASAFFKYRPMFYQGPDPNAPKLLMFRDSFAVYLMPYLNEHFSRSVYVWTPILIPDIVEKEKPDIVVQEIMEVFLTDLLEDKLTDPL